MKKGRILNRDLNNAISMMGHGDIIVIGDAGFPVPKDAICVDLAIEQDFPSIVQLLDILISDFIYEKVEVAEEQEKHNPLLFEKISTMCDRCSVDTVPHEDFIERIPKMAKVIVRSGSFEPWGNVALTSGVDAPVWFEKEGCTSPDYYKERVAYEEK